MRKKEKKCYPYNPFQGKRGMAMIEAFPLIWLMFVLMAATLGSWGIVHTAVLNSIAARNYTFFSFNHRSDLSYLRDFGAADYGGVSDGTSNIFFRNDGGSEAGPGRRFNFIASEKHPPRSNQQTATLRRVDFRVKQYEFGDRSDFLADPEHTKIADIIGIKNENKKVGPAWVMVGYGICLSEDC
ncbi:MAG: hypothetical protein OXM55_05730 [Bdellovibrionales bacterium]|nr:hypothetical protein [Bdellovibrionales bacterium]